MLSAKKLKTRRIATRCDINGGGGGNRTQGHPRLAGVYGDEGHMGVLGGHKLLSWSLCSVGNIPKPGSFITTDICMGSRHEMAFKWGKG